MIRRPRRSVRNRAALDPSHKELSTPITLSVAVAGGKLACFVPGGCILRGVPPILVGGNPPTGVTVVDDQNFELTYAVAVNVNETLVIPARMPQIRNRLGGYVSAVSMAIGEP